MKRNLLRVRAFEVVQMDNGGYVLRVERNAEFETLGEYEHLDAALAEMLRVADICKGTEEFCEMHTVGKSIANEQRARGNRRFQARLTYTVRELDFDE